MEIFKKLPEIGLIRSDGELTGVAAGKTPEVERKRISKYSVAITRIGSSPKRICSGRPALLLPNTKQAGP